MKNRFFLPFLTLLAVFLAFQSSADASVVTVKADFSGTAPAADKLKLDADPKCKMMHADGLMSDEVLVNPNGTLKNVFIYVKSGLEGKKFDSPKTPVIFDQIGCHYTPKVFGVMVNQPVEIRNSDDTLHNVHALPANSSQFNLGMPIKGMKLTKTFAKPEVMVKIKCEVHSWMKAYAGVVSNPFYGVTSDEGTVMLKDLPPGDYVIESWHEKYGTQEQKVTVSDSDQAVDFKFSA